MAGPQVWNSLPPNLRLCGQFRWLLKILLFRQWGHGTAWTVFLTAPNRNSLTYLLTTTDPSWKFSDNSCNRLHPCNKHHSIITITGDQEQIPRQLLTRQGKLEAVVVASALDNMKAESRLAAASCSLPRRYRLFVENQYGGRPHVVSYNMIIFVSKAGTLPYLMVFLNSTF